MKDNTTVFARLDAPAHRKLKEFSIFVSALFLQIGKLKLNYVISGSKSYFY